MRLKHPDETNAGVYCYNNMYNNNINTSTAPIVNVVAVPVDSASNLINISASNESATAVSSTLNGSEAEWTPQEATIITNSTSGLISVDAVFSLLT